MDLRPQETFLAVSGGCICVHMYISMLVSLYAQRKERSRLYVRDKIQADLCGTRKGYSPDICNLCPLPGLSWVPGKELRFLSSACAGGETGK